MNKIKIAIIFGTRPETIKMFPIISEINKYPHLMDCKIIVSGQHREMLDQMLEIFQINSDYDLNIMEQGQSLSNITKNSLLGIEKILKKERPSMVLVQGDTTTTFTGALAAFYQKIKIGHIEAGLRTHNKYYPFPEEVNRHLTSVLTDFHFTPTKKSYENLISEGVKREDIFISGNTVIDSLFLMIKENYIFREPLLKNKKMFDKKIILVTMHRRENWGKPLRKTCKVINKIIDEHPDVSVIFPLHKNPEIRKNVKEILQNKKDILLLDTLDWRDKYIEMSKNINLYGDGKASERIVKKILYNFNLINQSPDEFIAK